MITGAAGAADPELAEAFATVLERGGEFGLDALLTEIVRKRDGLRALHRRSSQRRCGRSSTSVRGVRLRARRDRRSDRRLGLAAARASTPAVLRRLRACRRGGGARQVLEEYACPMLARGLPSADPVTRLQLLERRFLKSRRRALQHGKIASTKALLNALPDLRERYRAAAAGSSRAADRLALFRMLEGTRAALTIADWLIARYEQLKSGRGFLDFNDLINRTVRLLARQDAGPWVHYKLDQGIDHILIDEAQDTSPDQWEVVERLAEEFFAGCGARDNVHRTLFAVGDEKQSIYSFQGADRRNPSPQAASDSPSACATPSGSFEQVEADAVVPLDRRCACGRRPRLRRRRARGAASPTIPIRSSHKAIRAGAPGYVESGRRSAPTPSRSRTTGASRSTMPQRPPCGVAEMSPRRSSSWLDAGEIIEGTGKRLDAGRRAGAGAQARPLRPCAVAQPEEAAAFPVAGADRLSLPAHIAVKDLIALGRFLLQPEDDLSLAAVLQEPDLRRDRGDAFRACRRPRERYRWIASLRRKARDDPLLAAIVEPARRLGERGGLQAGVRILCRRARPRRRAQGMIAPARPRGRRHPRRVPGLRLAEEQTGLPGLEAFLATLESAGPRSSARWTRRATKSAS